MKKEEEKLETEAFLRIEKGLVVGYNAYAKIPLTTEITVIGRDNNCACRAGVTDIRVHDDYVSRNHASVFSSPNNHAYTIRERDGGTTNGTFVNENRLLQGISQVLNDGDSIQLARTNGIYRVIFRFRVSDGTLMESMAIEQSPYSRLRVDLKARRVWVEDREVFLRKKEFDLFSLLYQNEGKACSKDLIAQEVWGDEGGIVSQETIEQDISRVRKALGTHSSHKYIKTIHGGYRFDIK